MSEEMKQALELEATKEGLAYVDSINRGESPWTDSDMELAYEDGMIEGAEWMYERLIEDAVECKVKADADGLYTTETWDKMNNYLSKIGMKDGDKVKLIITKQEEE